MKKKYRWNVKGTNGYETGGVIEAENINQILSLVAVNPNTQSIESFEAHEIHNQD